MATQLLSAPWELEGEAVRFSYNDHQLRVAQVLPGVFRVTLLRHPFHRGSQESVQPESARVLAELPMEMENGRDGTATVSGGGVRLRVELDRPALSLDGKARLSFETDGWHLELLGSLSEGERIYGLGEPDQRRPVSLDRRGGTYQVFNRHQPAPSRLVLPVFYSSRGYGVFIDNSWPGRFDMGASDPATWSYRAEGGELDLYLFAGSLPALVDQFTQLIGRPAMLPRWTLGFIQSKFGYRNRAEVEKVAAEFRSRGIPCDGIVLDLYWFQHMGDLRFDEERFPDPAGMIRNLAEQGFHVITIEEPYVVKPARLHAEGAALGYFARFPDGRVDFPFWAYPEGAALVDFSNPEAADWWGRQHEELLRLGIAGWWLDLNEPEQHYPELQHAGGPAARVHNTFGLRMIEAVSRAQASFAPGSRPFIMSRSGWLGMAAHGATTWSGDVDTTFEALAKQPALGLGISLSGIPGWNTDAGGFIGARPTPELYVRWLQFAAFTPLMRPHGNQQPREPWQFGKRAEKICTRYIRLRGQMVPYTYSVLYETYRTGAPLMRPLVWAYPDDPAVADLADQYLYGPSLLVAPVLAEGARQREVYLPEGLWYDFESRREVDGGRWLTVNAPLARLPLFVRAGSIIPLAPVTDHDWSEPPAELTLTIWPGAAPAEFTLYEDDGTTLDYRDGICATTLIRATAGADLITIGRPEGPYARKIPPRGYLVEVVRRQQPARVHADGRPLPACDSREELAGAVEGWAFDRTAHTLSIKLAPAPREREIRIEA